MHIGSINAAAENIGTVVRDEHLRLVFQRGALSISRTSFGFEELQNDRQWYEESARLEAIIALLHTLADQPTDVAWMQVRRGSFNLLYSSDDLLG